VACVSTPGPTAAHRREVLIEDAEQAQSVGDLFGAVSRRLRGLVPFDAAVWLATDPATSLPTAPTRAENLARLELEHRDCVRLWEREFLVEDVNLYRDLARADMPAAGLRMATGDRPARSPRFREQLRPWGFDDELRAVMRVDGSPWASVALMRESGRPAFDVSETELVASLSRPLAEALREHARPARDAPAGPDARGPGLVLFAPGGELISVNDDALGWLDELAWLDETSPQFEDRTSFGIRLPLMVASTLVRARAIAEEREHGTARARLRSGSGRWLVCHASCLRRRDGEIGNTALVIEPAKASEIAPIITQAYQLSARERQITQLIAQGCGTAEIAGRLHLSTHTVRDHIKAVFEKVGVSSRGELVATLFAEHYAPIHGDPATREQVEL
jgi:DNA-binding CsgD family transcriptional regulator